MCATTAGPYQSPACFPIVRPKWTILWRPNWAEGQSPNQDTKVRWYISFMCTSASSAEPSAWLWSTGGGLRSEGPEEPCMEDSKEATRRLAAVVVHVSVSKGWRDSAPDQVQSKEEEICIKHWKNKDRCHVTCVMCLSLTKRLGRERRGTGCKMGQIRV